MNSVNLIGNLGQDPELRYTPSGKAVVNLRLAVDSRRQDHVNWFTVVAWGKTAEAVDEHLAKGSRVAVSGRLQSRTYTSNGRSRSVVEVVARQVEFLDRPGTNGRSAQEAGEPEEEIPFEAQRRRAGHT